MQTFVMVMMAIMRMVSIMLLTSLWEQMGRGTWLLTNRPPGVAGHADPQPANPQIWAANMCHTHPVYTNIIPSRKKKKTNTTHWVQCIFYKVKSESGGRGLYHGTLHEISHHVRSCSLLKKKSHDKLQLSCEYLDPSKSLLLVLQLSDSQMVR